jgi:hypothetical protein
MLCFYRTFELVDANVIYASDEVEFFRKELGKPIPTFLRSFRYSGLSCPSLDFAGLHYSSTRVRVTSSMTEVAIANGHRTKREAMRTSNKT